MVDRNWVG